MFPGQGAQFPGMGKDLHDMSAAARTRFEEANEVLGFDISSIMFGGTDEALKQTAVTQPAIFLHSVILAECLGDAFNPDMVAGHSLGEFSALVAAGSLNFADGLRLVSAVQTPCKKHVKPNHRPWRQCWAWTTTLWRACAKKHKVLWLRQTTTAPVSSSSQGKFLPLRRLAQPCRKLVPAVH